MGQTPRAAFLESHEDALLLDPLDAASIDRYLLARGLARLGELPSRVEAAGAGNMNLTLRVTLRKRSLILKQGRPWVEKYPHIAAPWDRTLVEGTFYEAVRGAPAVASRMPALLDLDTRHHVIAIEDLGAEGDLTSLYRAPRLRAADLEALLQWLADLRAVTPAAPQRERLVNRAMRALNHEHIFALPLADGNGLDLDAITTGLGAAARELTRDAAYCGAVAVLGRRYLADGPSLVHGDYFPGSWVRSAAGVRIIDPEFCFLGAREFDYGVMIAHLALARADAGPGERVLAAARREALDEPLLLGFAGAEIMRRLVGVAQLPLPYGLDDKRRLLELSRSLILDPARGLACWA